VTADATIGDDYIRRFWSHVEKSDGCWNWTASVASHGYGNAWDGVTVLTAHKLSWRIHFGAVPDGSVIMHTCDNPKCVRPDHLLIGTHVDNMRDMARKGRRRGCRYRRLTTEERLRIRELRARGVSQKEIAKELGRDVKTIWIACRAR
jgi:hypothetical protein